jgi:hypothetical protein
MAYTSGITEERDVKVMSARAGAAVSPYRILQGGTDSDEVIHATNQNNFLVGVSGNGSENGKATYEENDPIAMKYGGIVYVEMSGTGSRGDRITAGAAGVGVKHTSLPGSWILGVATKAWKDGEVIPVEVCKHYIGTYAT